MNKNKLITVPDNLKVTIETLQEVSAQAAMDVPEDMKAMTTTPEAVVAVNVIEQAPFNVEVYQIPHTKLGQEALKGLIEVPGATGAKVVIPGTPIAGQSREVVNLGGVEDFPGGNPGNKIGYDGIVRK